VEQLEDQSAEIGRRTAPDAGEIRVESNEQEDPMRYCPVCSKRLESRRCKLICNVCGYYMSCADYY
jgi:hypothetical protein